MVESYFSAKLHNLVYVEVEFGLMICETFYQKGTCAPAFPCSLFVSPNENKDTVQWYEQGAHPPVVLSVIYYRSLTGKVVIDALLVSNRRKTLLQVKRDARRVERKKFLGLYLCSNHLGPKTPSASTKSMASDALPPPKKKKKKKTACVILDQKSLA